MAFAPPQARSSKAYSPPKASPTDADYEIREFLEGLLEGFRAAAAANAAQGGSGPKQPKWFEREGNRGGQWSDLNELEKSMPQFAVSVEAYRENAKSPRTPRSNASPAGYPGGMGGATPRGRGGDDGGGFASDPLSTMMRRHALRSFLEETCGSVAKAFEQMAALAVKKSLGSQGGTGLPDQRMKYKFSPMEFQKTLSQMGYGVGAGYGWWNALFRSLDCDEDGAVSLQDMYDALVLDLPPLPGQAAPGSVFFSTADATRSDRSPQRAFSPNRSDTSLERTLDLRTRSAYDNQCRTCGSRLNDDAMYCRSCGTKRV